MSGLCFFLSLYTLTTEAQEPLKVKVVNVCSERGKVLMSTSKGQYAMTDATGTEMMLELKGVPLGKCKLYVYHDENGNFQLDRENGVPFEFCAMLDLDVTVDTKTVEVVLEDFSKKEKLIKKQEEDGRQEIK